MIKLDLAKWMPAPERAERLVIETTVDKKIALAAPAAEAYLRNKKGTHKHDWDKDPNDSFQYAYTLNIEYFGDCVEVLTAFCNLMDVGAVIKAKTEELNHGYCLAQEFFEKIERLRKAVQ